MIMRPQVAQATVLSVQLTAAPATPGLSRVRASGVTPGPPGDVAGEIRRRRLNYHLTTITATTFAAGPGDKPHWPPRRPRHDRG